MSPSDDRGLGRESLPVRTVVDSLQRCDLVLVLVLLDELLERHLPSHESGSHRAEV
jgi:hypothetical protein